MTGKRVVEIPEHRVERDALRGLSLSEADRRLCDRLAAPGDVRLEILELNDGLRVTTREWVGVVELSQVELHVVPKLAGEHLGLLRMLEWASGLHALRPTESERRIDVTGRRLLDLVAAIFTRLSEQIIRTGLRSTYVQREEAIPALRGRLLVDRQLRRLPGRFDRLECRFDERTTDVFDNQLLLAAARYVAVRAHDEEVRRRAARVRAHMLDVCDDRGLDLMRRRVIYDRLNRHYKPAHELAWLVLEAQGLEDLYDTKTTSSHAFLIDMNRLFERFVEKLLATALAPQDVDVHFQATSHSVLRRADGRTYSTQRPDVLARFAASNIDVPLDAKYKRYSVNKVATSDIAQAFMYAQGFGPEEAERVPQAVVVFPAEGSAPTRESISVRAPSGADRAGLTVLGVPVAALLAEIDLPPDERQLVAQLSGWLAEVALAAGLSRATRC